MKPKTEQTRINLLVPMDLFDAINREAERLCISRTDFIKMTLAQAIRSSEAVQQLPAALNAVKSMSKDIEDFQQFFEGFSSTSDNNSND